MNQDLATMQKHLTLARDHAKELKIQKRDLLDEVYQLKQQVVKTKRRYRTVVAVITMAALWIGYVNMQYAADVRWASGKLKETADLQYRFDNILEALHYQNSRVLELEHANEQLIKHCRPCDVQRAIKATPLPDLVRS